MKMFCKVLRMHLTESYSIFEQKCRLFQFHLPKLELFWKLHNLKPRDTKRHNDILFATLVLWVFSM